jgi:hypothetical protein
LVCLLCFASDDWMDASRLGTRRELLIARARGCEPAGSSRFRNSDKPLGSGSF